MSTPKAPRPQIDSQPAEQQLDDYSAPTTGVTSFEEATPAAQQASESAAAPIRPQIEFESASEQEATSASAAQTPAGEPYVPAQPAPAPQPQPTPTAYDEAPGRTPPTTKGVARGISAWVHRTFPGHEHAFWGAVIGLLVALLVFAIGIWRALFIALLVSVGALIGQFLDGDTRATDIINRVKGMWRN